MASSYSQNARLGHFTIRRSSLTKDTALSLDRTDPLTFPDISECHAALRQPHLQEPFDEGSLMSRLRRPATVGCISVLMLLIVTFTDFALEVVHAQMHRLDVVHYDALSTEVIRPPFRYTTASTKDEKPRLGLGSAAISSVTNALGPILPFAGGVDLRRDFSFSSDGWFSSLSSVVGHMRDAFAADADLKATSPILAVPRGGGRVPGGLVKVVPPLGKKMKTEHVITLAAPEPFVPVTQISELTLSDVATAFRYAMDSTKSTFDEASFFNGQLPRVKTMLALVESAVSLSRGKEVKAAVTGTTDGPTHGDIDALQFCAAMRIFAEWRLLRQTPEGYKGFALGMSLGQKDIVQNVLKIEQATHAWLDHQRELKVLQGSWEKETHSINCPLDESDCISDSLELRTPTLNDLLQYEIDTGVHDRLPRLKERSAAMGLLWVRRQLHYQTSLFANIMHVPERFPSTKAAISAAYNEVYDRFHGWAVQKIFNYSFQAAPEAEEVYKFMNPHRLREVANAAKRDIGLPNSRNCRVAPESNLNPFEKFGQHVGREWDKLTLSVSQVFGAPPRPLEMDVRGGDCDSGEGRSTQDQELYIVKEMTSDAHEKIHAYLNVAQPLLEDLSILFDAHNMDDPTKV